MTAATHVLEPLDGIDALVTGSSRGLGLGITRAFAAAGARVWMVADLDDELDAAAEAVRAEGGRVEARVLDVADRAGRKALADEISAERSFRVLVNNAAVLEREVVVDLDDGHWDRVLGVNLTAPVLLTRDVLPALASNGGSIINVSSRAGMLAFPGQAAYCASKFGMEGWTRCLAAELVGTPVSVNTVTPGLAIKPTSLTTADVARLGASDEWHDPIELAPAFVFLAGRRGDVSGFRFDAQTLTRSLAEAGVDGTLERIHAVAEHVPPHHRLPQA